VVALTAAPPPGFTGPTVDDRLADESALAALAASMYRNIRHIVRRPKSPQVLRQMREMHCLSDGPLSNPTNLAWWEDMHDAAAEQGASVLLFGSSGNFTISGGGPDQLRDTLLENGAIRWLQAAAPLGGWSAGRWRNILSTAIGPSLASSVYKLLMKIAGRSALLDHGVPILREPYRQVAEARLSEAFGDPRPPASYFDFRCQMLQDRDQAELVTLARWNLDPRDPTADRLLVEFCLSLPNDLLVGRNGAARPLYDRAMADRLPREVLTNARRGYQTPEWYEHFRPDELRDAFSRYGRNTLIADFLDLGYVGRLIDAWPTSGWGERSNIYLYRNSLIGALAVADYIDLHSPH
jgi:asparagine synthase (glutamine-hydrolysing)